MIKYVRFKYSSICKCDDYDNGNDNPRCNEGFLEERVKVGLKF